MYIITCFKKLIVIITKDNIIVYYCKYTVHVQCTYMYIQADPVLMVTRTGWPLELGSQLPTKSSPKICSIKKAYVVNPTV